jgi:biopolymer transport protein ExbD
MPDELRFEDYVLPLRNGVVTNDQRAEPHAMRIGALIEAMKPRVAGGLTLYVAPEVPYETLMIAAYNASRAGAHRIGLAAAHPTDVIGVLPLSVPTTPNAAPSTPARDPDDAPLGMVVSIMGDELRLWSISQLEGTLTEPLGKWPATGAALDVEPLGAALDDIVKKRWYGKERAADTHQIIVQADPSVPFRTVVRALAAARATADGETRFREVTLAHGLQ